MWEEIECKKVRESIENYLCSKTLIQWQTVTLALYMMTKVITMKKIRAILYVEAIIDVWNLQWK
jgi:hypothetical protein